LNINAQRHFDSRADNYETEVGEEYPQWLKWHLIEKYTPHGGYAIDVGGGNGRHAIDTALKFECDTFCIDLSEGMLVAMNNRANAIALPRQAIHRLHAICASAASLPVKDSSADIAWSYATLLLLPDQNTAIAELMRVVKPGGIVILDIGNVWNFGWLYWRRYYRKRGLPGIFPISRTRAASLIDNLGGDIIEDIPTGVLSPFLLLPLFDKYPIFRRFIHQNGRYPDLDGIVSKWMPLFATRHYFVVKKRGIQ
jgi:ubiquinone/menaquinone biosynthesis C-methylase UbiE